MVNVYAEAKTWATAGYRYLQSTQAHAPAGRCPRLGVVNFFPVGNCGRQGLVGLLPRWTGSRRGLEPCDWRAGSMVWRRKGEACDSSFSSVMSLAHTAPWLAFLSTPPAVHRSFCCYCYPRFRLRVRCTALSSFGLFALCSSRMSCPYPWPHNYRLVSCSVITPAPNSAIQLA